MKFVWITIVQETMSRIEIEFAKYTNTHIHKEKKKCIQEKVQRYYKKNLIYGAKYTSEYTA